MSAPGRSAARTSPAPCRRRRRGAALAAAATGLLLFAATPSPAAAQDAEQDVSVLTVQDLRSPQSPAFVLLGVSPTGVERPMTPKAFAVSLISAAQGETNIIPENFALEVSPFWMFRHPGLTFEKYYQPGFFLGIAQTLSLSLATQRVGGDGDGGKSSNVGFGARAMLVTGDAHPLLPERRQALHAVLDERLDLIEQCEDGVLSASECESQTRRLRARVQQAALAIQELDLKRVGFQVDIAGAVAGRFPDDSFEAGYVSRWGFWLTPAYRFAHREEPYESRYELVGVLRYIDDRPAPVTDAEMPAVEEDSFDVGGRAIWNLNDRFSLSYEAVHRMIIDSPSVQAPESSTRSVVILEYRILEGSYVFASFGKDFASFGVPAGLASVFGINFGLGDKPMLDLGDGS